MTNREKFKQVFGIDIRFESAELIDVDCAEEWLNEEYCGAESKVEERPKGKWLNEVEE